MAQLHRRVAKLEQKEGALPGRSTRWHQVVVDVETEAQAIARYESENGSIGHDNVILRVIVDPAPGVPLQ